MKNLIAFLIVCSLLFFAQLSFAEQIKQKEQMTAYSNENYGLTFRYPQAWELQSHPASPRSECEFEVDLRPPSWLTHLKTAEYRRYYDFPLQILICRKDYESFIRGQGYYKKEKAWVNSSHGLDMEAAELKGKGWHGIYGEVSFKTITKTGEQGPESFLQQAVLTNGKGLSILIIMEYTGPPLYTWNIDDLLKSVRIKPSIKTRK